MSKNHTIQINGRKKPVLYHYLGICEENAVPEPYEFTRQHIHALLQGSEEVTRFDLLALNFLIYAKKKELEENATRRYSRFMKSTNEILTGCFMGKIYVQNPYECFLLMCILSEDPLCTYAEVWEMSL